MKEPEGQETRYRFGELGELLEVIQPGSASTAYTYDPSRNQLWQTDAKVRVFRGYDDLNRMTSETQDPDGLNLITLHKYDPNGNEEELTDAKGQRVVSDYDSLNRLASQTFVALPEEAAELWRLPPPWSTSTTQRQPERRGRERHQRH
jgi:YD repeat-containing protein